MEVKNVELIPIGHYCYVVDPNVKTEQGEIATVYCPYYTTKEIAGVTVTHCSFLDESDYGGVSNEDYEKLIKHFGSEDKLDEKTELDLLGDSCKACGERYEEDLNIDFDTEIGKQRYKDKQKEWFNRIKSLNR